MDRVLLDFTNIILNLLPRSTIFYIQKCLERIEAERCSRSYIDKTETNLDHNSTAKDTHQLKEKQNKPKQ